MEKFGRIALKTLLWIIGSVIFLVLLVFILIQVPAVQNFAKNKAVNYLQGKIHTKVEIGHISLGLPKLLVLEDVYFEDQKRDTLIAGDKLKVDISMLKLLDNKLEINEINLQGITANVSRGADSTFNFDYIIKAFASEQKKEPKPKDTTSTMKFSLDKVILDRIKLSYKDVTTGNDVKFYLGHFDTRVKEFDMDKMKFSIPKITLSGVNARIIQTPKGSSINQAATVDTATKSINLDLDLETIDISKIKVDYQSNEMKTKVDLGKFLVEMDDIDLKNQKVGIKSIELSNTTAALVLNKPATVAEAVVKTAKKIDTLITPPVKQKGWYVNLGKFTMANNNVKFDNNAIKAVRRGLDYGHMDIRNLNTEITDLAYNPDSASGKINEFTFADKSGLAVRRFHTNFFYGPKGAFLRDLLLETPSTVIQKEVTISYPSIASISKNLGSLGINANLDGTRIGLRDILIIMPTMASMEPFRSSPNSVIRVNGRVAGKVGDISIPNLEIWGFGSTHIQASAKMRGLPDVNKAYMDINIKDFNTSRSDIFKLAPKGSIPATVSIPERLNLKGDFKGTLNNFNTRLNFNSSYGSVNVVASMKNAMRKSGQTYTASLRVKDFNAGALIKKPQMVGKLTLNADIKGAGIDPKTLSLQLKANVASAYVKGYNYRNLVMNATSNRGSYTAVARMKDPNINFDLNAKANMNKKYPSIVATLMVDSINLQNLHFVKDPMRFHGKVVANVPTADPDYLNGNIEFTDMIVVNKAQRIVLDTVSIVSTATADSSTLQLKAPMLSARLAGQYQLTQIAPALQSVINKYFNTATAGAPVPKPTRPQQFTFDLRFVKTNLVTQFVPDLKQLDPVNINGRFNSNTGELLVNGAIPRVVYGTNTINNARLNINTGNNALNYSFNVDQIKVGSSLNLLNTSIAGAAQNNQLGLALTVRDAAKKDRYRISGNLSALPNQYQFSFVQNGLLLDYTQWAVNPNNALQFGGKGIMARDFTISNANQILSVNSNPQQPNAPMTVDFRNFKIETLTKLAQQDSLLVGGTINGNAVVSNFQASPQFTSNINITDFNFKGDTVGNIALKVNNQTANAFAADVRITGYGNQVNLTGLYYTTPSSRFDLNLDIVNLNMKSIEGFSFGALRQSSGSLNGGLKITGTTAAPQVRGDINFNKVAFNVSMLNSYFRMPNEKITFNSDGILFNDFTLIDSAGNKAIVRGAVYTKTFTDFRFGMDISTDNFQVINSTRKDNQLYYGKLFLDSRIKIRGDMNKPVVDADLTVNEKTDLTVVLPTSDPSIEDRKGVVEFIDKDAPASDSILLARQLDSLKKSDINGMDVSANIKVNKNANFNIVIDERNGDVVHLKGEANLNGAIDPSGKINLTGTYVVNEGSYNLSYATVKRTFNFKRGSTITWTGDPTSAILDFTAVYVAKVPPIDLVDDQLSGSETERTIYKQKLPFNVNLILRDELLKPKINFDIVLPDSNYTVSGDVINNVNTRLAQIRQDPNELNKQVLGVLILGHFIGQNPLQSQGGSAGVEGAIRSSVSGLLSDQLNKLAGNLIAGVDLSFDLESGQDYSTGTAQNRTDLNVGLSKRFLNDRLTVTVGNNFNLEGQNQPGQKTTNIAGNISVGYKLTKDGRYMIRAYRKDQYVVIQGQVVETGVAFSLTMDYNRFSQLFKRTRAEKEAKRRMKEEKKREKAEKKAQEQQNEQDRAQREQQQSGAVAPREDQDTQEPTTESN